MTVEGRPSPLRVHRRERLVLTGVSQRKFRGENAIELEFEESVEF